MKACLAMALLMPGPLVGMFPPPQAHVHGPYRILHFGDSHLTSPAAWKVFGGFFREQFGEGGAGLSLPFVQGRPGVRAVLGPGWRRSGRPGSDPQLGLAGAFVESPGGAAWARLEGRFARIRLHVLRRSGDGRLTLRVDGRDLGQVEAGAGAGRLALLEGAVPLGSHRVELLAQGRIRLLGVSLETGDGAVYSPLGLSGAAAAWMTDLPEDLFAAQVRAESPDLLILAFGTNEAAAPRFDAAAYAEGMKALLVRFRRAAPKASLVLVGPPDGQLRRGRPGALAEIIQVQKELAAREGALFVDQREAMGGAGAISAWIASGLAGRDAVHLTAQGYDRLARVVVADLAPWAGMKPQAAAGPVRRPAGPRPENRKPVEAPPVTIHVFTSKDGQIYLTDDPSTVSGLKGEWTRREP